MKTAKEIFDRTISIDIDWRTEQEIVQCMEEYADQFIDELEECFDRECSCGRHKHNKLRYDNKGIDLYQRIQKILIETGRINKEQCIRD